MRRFRLFFSLFMTIKSLRLCFSMFLVSATAVWAAVSAGPGRLEGDVKDSKGQPVAGAEVHIKAKDGSQERIARTDGRGHYGIDKLAATDYEIVLFVNRQIKASLNSIKVLGTKPTQQNFKLTGQYAANVQKKHTHMVYVPADTGSHLGGRWVEVDDNGNGAAGIDNVQKADGSAIRSLQSQTGGMRGGGN
jgi:hypothetical protein